MIIAQKTEQCDVFSFPATIIDMVLCLSNQKGGVGKTTCAVNLGAGLADLGLRVLLLDLDPQGNLSSGLGTQNMDITSYDLFEQPSLLSSAIQNTAHENLYLIPANADLSGASVELVRKKNREFYLKNILQPIRADYDIILIDCPPSLGILTLNALCAAEQVLIPLQCEFYALDGVLKLVRTINLVKKNLNNPLRVFGIILTMYDSRTRLSLEVSEEVKRVFKGRVFSTIIPRSIRLAEAPSYGKSIFLYDKDSVAAQSYKKLSREVMLRWKKEKTA